MTREEAEALGWQFLPALPDRHAASLKRGPDFRVNVLAHTEEDLLARIERKHEVWSKPKCEATLYQEQGYGVNDVVIEVPRG